MHKSCIQAGDKLDHWPHSRNHVLHGSRDTHGKGQFWGLFSPLNGIGSREPDDQFTTHNYPTSVPE